MSKELSLERLSTGCLVCVSHSGRKNDARPRINYRGDVQYLYRLVYRWLHRDPVAGKVLDHLCRNPRCCEPTHLQEVEQRTNARRAFGMINEAGACRIHGAGDMTTHKNKAVIGGRAVRCKACLRDWSAARRREIEAEMDTCAVKMLAEEAR